MHYERAWVLWDGECDFCSRVATWGERHDRTHQLALVAYQVCPTPPMTPTLYAACGDAMHVVRPDGSILRAGRAALYVLQRCGYPLPARLLSLPPFIWAVEIGYGLVARNRDFVARFLFTRGPNADAKRVPVNTRYE